MTDLDLKRFERLCRRAGLVPLARAEHRLGTIYLGEGLVPFDAETQEVAHWCVIWAVGHRGVDVAERFWQPVGTTGRERAAAGLSRAAGYLETYHAAADGAAALRAAR
ncbi:MAG: hypothetical protein L6R19_19120 [Alphaproteobacteria bacterium]|nr:hypothetical protein [Alphaproteobacteria bacterium]